MVALNNTIRIYRTISLFLLCLPIVVWYDGSHPRGASGLLLVQAQEDAAAAAAAGAGAGSGSGSATTGAGTSDVSHPPKPSIPSEDKIAAMTMSSNMKAATTTASSNNNLDQLDVIDLDARSFSQSIGDGYVWLIEFYAPDCIHCVSFAPTYAAIALHYHSRLDEKKIKVARINGEIERALVSRFQLYAYPSFFVINGWNVYSFEETRTKRGLMKFVEGGYRDTDPIPFYMSPMGPMGQMQGLLIRTGVLCADLFEFSRNQFGLSPLFTGSLLFGTLFIGCFFCIVILAVMVTPKEKQN